MNFIKKHPYVFQVVLCLVIGLAISCTQHFMSGLEAESFVGSLLVGAVFYAPFVLFPIIATLYEILLLLGVSRPQKTEAMQFSRKILAGIYDLILLLMAVLYGYLYLALEDVVFGAGWQEQLYNAQRHSPVAPEHGVTICVILLLAAVGVFFLKCTNVKEVPPLTTVLAISATYLGGALIVVFTYQVVDFTDYMDYCLLLLPIVYFAIVAREVIVKMREYEIDGERSSKLDKVPLLGACNRLLQQKNRWPVAAFLLMWPLLGIVIIILLLFGQEPASVIRAFTETSDFRLSTKVSPQNLYYDEHYLCTVAAGGDRKIVKPLRRGVRHGHEVIVNRQLCVANAFEQVLEERTPGLHRRVRNFYDTYGFPVAKLIRKNWMADMVYFLMKPLEWLFVMVLYLTEVHPEDRIALQYTGKSLQDFNDKRGELA